MKIKIIISPTLAFLSIALLSKTQAVSPAPDGGYPGGDTAEGQTALFSLTTGGFNTAVGVLSLRSNATGNLNTGVGAGTLLLNNADENTAVGVGALLNNIGGPHNTATGAFALFNNTIGDSNTAIGANALWNNTIATGNTAIGFDGLFNVNVNANATGTGNTAIGYGAGINVTTANSVICIGHDGQNVTASTWIESVYGTTTQSGTTAPVIVSDGGQLGAVASSARFKKDIATMDETSEAILSLRPVTFHYKTDAKGIPQFGLIAEEVAKVNPALVLPDKGGKPYTVRYDAVNPMLLNEFLKEHKRVLELRSALREQEAIIAQLKDDRANQEATISSLKDAIETVIVRLKEQDLKIQRVSAQVQINSPAAQVVVSNE
jgi:hypothetical protein